MTRFFGQSVPGLVVHQFILTLLPFKIFLFSIIAGTTVVFKVICKARLQQDRVTNLD